MFAIDREGRDYFSVSALLFSLWLQLFVSTLTLSVDEDPGALP